MFPIPLSLEPMEAEPIDALPGGAGWQFEPKYDGFRCVLYRDGEAVALQSRRQKPLGRYFPEIIAAATALPVTRFVLDGELVIPDQPFDTLQLRLHPAASRIAKLSREHPARLIAFDMLGDPDGRSLLDAPFADRRHALECFFAAIGADPTFVLSKATRSHATANGWLARLGHGLDGIAAKRLDLAYQPGRRAMRKFKLWRTIDCVVGGLYYRRGTRSVEYLLLGLYDEAGRLNYVGRCAWPGNGGDAGRIFEPLVGGPGAGFSGRAPAGVSRWSGREREVVPVKPVIVVEASADHIEAGHFRHGSRLVRLRDDKAPEACTMDQLGAVTAAAP